MKVESEHGDVAGLFTEIADIVDEYGGHLHPGLIIRNSGQSYCAAITPQGLAAAPEAFLGLLKGKNFGKQLVKLI